MLYVYTLNWSRVLRIRSDLIPDIFSFSFQGVLGEMVIRRVGEFPCMIGGALGGSLTLLASAFAPNMVTIVVLIGVGTGS